MPEARLHRSANCPPPRTLQSCASSSTSTAEVPPMQFKHSCHENSAPRVRASHCGLLDHYTASSACGVRPVHCEWRTADGTGQARGGQRAPTNHGPRRMPFCAGGAAVARCGRTQSGCAAGGSARGDAAAGAAGIGAAGSRRQRRKQLFWLNPTSKSPIERRLRTCTRHMSHQTTCVGWGRAQQG